MSPRARVFCFAERTQRRDQHVDGNSDDDGDFSVRGRAFSARSQPEIMRKRRAGSKAENRNCAVNIAFAREDKQ